VVFAPHLYDESITMDQSLGVTLVGIQRGCALAQRAAALWGAPLRVGEWGSFRDEAANRRYYEKFMTQVDASREGTAVWVWKQGCGDPHVYPSDVAGNIRRLACPEGTSLPTRTAELAPVTGAYPRSVPGRLLTLESGSDSVRIVGSTVGAGPVDGPARAGSLDIWVPGASEPRARTIRGVADLRSVRVPAGSAPQDPSGGGCWDARPVPTS
jgi:endoglycosylceramidase